MDRDELLPQLARAASTAIRAFESLPQTSTNVAALRLLGAAIENFYDRGYSEADLMRAGYAIMRAREEAILSDG